MNLGIITSKVEAQFKRANSIVEEYQQIMDTFYNSRRAMLLLPGSRITAHGGYKKFSVSTSKYWIADFYTINGLIYVDSVAEDEATLKNGFLYYIDDSIKFDMEHHKSTEIICGHHNLLIDDLEKIAKIKPWVDVADRVKSGDAPVSQMMGWFTQDKSNGKWTGKSQRSLEKKIKSGKWHTQVLGDQSMTEKISQIYAKYDYSWLSIGNQVKFVDMMAMNDPLDIIEFLTKKQKTNE